MYYNRFRYYDKDTGQYISPDSIGLLGGFNPYEYVRCPTGWLVTNYGPLGSEGRVPLGSVPNIPRGGIVTSESIVSGTIPSKSGTVPKAESIWKIE